MQQLETALGDAERDSERIQRQLQDEETNHRLAERQLQAANDSLREMRD